MRSMDLCHEEQQGMKTRLGYKNLWHHLHKGYLEANALGWAGICIRLHVSREGYDLGYSVLFGIPKLYVPVGSFRLN